jgi:hypothetical protein
MNTNTLPENSDDETPYNFDLLPFHMWNNNNPKLDPDSVEDMVEKYRVSLDGKQRADWEEDYRLELNTYYGGRKENDQPLIAGKWICSLFVLDNFNPISPYFIYR